MITAIDGIKYLRNLRKLHKEEKKNIDGIISLLMWYKAKWDWHKFCEGVPKSTNVKFS